MPYRFDERGVNSDVMQNFKEELLVVANAAPHCVGAATSFPGLNN